VILLAFGKPRKRFSQNFLIDNAIAGRIVEFLNIESSDIIFEIGPGRGILTDIIAASGASAFCFEIDRDLANNLKVKFRDYPNLRIINQDFLTVLPADYHPGKLKIIGNIPYDITSPVLDWMIQYRHSISWAVITAQKELADRISSGPNSRNWAPLSIFCQCFFDIKSVMTIMPKSFYPSPKVVSSTLRFEPKERFRIDDWDYFEKIVRLSFRQRRKLLANNLKELPGLTGDKMEDVLMELNLNKKVRAEEIGIETFIHLAKKLKGLNIS
jgi:16S rRNA (adenine1518-N6/adenine1519-N6)-dimethyltransferase